MSKLTSVCVYCGSFNSAKPEYLAAAERLGTLIGQEGVLVYGGSTVGLMGRCADAALKAGGKVIGIIPTFLSRHEPKHPGLSELIETEDMHSRKRIMADKSDAFVVLPGGMGTMDELCEITVWRQLALHHKPIIMVNLNGFWNHLRAQFEYMAEEGFIRPQNREILRYVDSVEDVIPALHEEFAKLKSGDQAAPGPAHGNEKLPNWNLNRT
jgi:uncharacterized protein (TIGR00730 family)